MSHDVGVLRSLHRNTAIGSKAMDSWEAHIDEAEDSIES